MIMKLTRYFLLLAAAFAALAIRAQEMTVSPDKAAGVYAVGQTVHWRVAWKGAASPPAAQFRLLSGGLTQIGRGDLSFSNNAAALETKFDAPGTLLVEVKWGEGSKRRATGGAVAAPEKIALAAPRPADFDEFWQAKVAELERIPAHPRLESAPAGNTNVSYWKITMDNIRGAHIEGQLARPARGEKFPALLQVQWAGVYGLKKDWVTGRAKAGWLALNIEAHDLPIDQPEDFYQQQGKEPIKDYPAIGNDDRETSYFLRMYLSCYRALEYLTQREDWDGKTLVVMGGSQGGLQTLMLAGLHPQKLTAALAMVPAGCDLLGGNVGRSSGWPQWCSRTSGGKDPQKVRAACRYYDVANFTPHIQCPVLVGLGLRDETCPPAGVFAALNQITAPRETVILPESGHLGEHGSQAAYERRCERVWLPALLRGEPAPVQP